MTSIMSMNRIKLLLLLGLILTITLFGCTEKTESPPKEALSLLHQVLKFQQKQAPLGKWGWIEDWKVLNTEYDKVNNQVLAQVRMETTNYFLLLKMDLRKRGGNWVVYGLRKEDSLNKVDLKEPYRYWFRQFVFSTSLH